MMNMYEKYSLLEEMYPGNNIDSYNKRICTLLKFIQSGGFITAELDNDNGQVSIYKVCKVRFDRRVFNKDYDIHNFHGFIMAPKFKYSDFTTRSDDITENYFNKITLKMWDNNDIRKPVILYYQKFPNEYFNTNKDFTLLINLCKIEMINEEKENKRMYENERNYELCKSPLLKNSSSNKICDTCIKSDVCTYRTMVEETSKNMESEAGAINFLDVNITCKKWRRDEPVSKGPLTINGRY